MKKASSIFGRFAKAISRWAGKPVTFVGAAALVVVWAATGPLFGFAEGWQLVINTGTTIVTFLMVFVLQNAQTRDTSAIQAKLDEIILTSRAENRYVGIENLDDDELDRLEKRVVEAAKARDAGRGKRQSRARSGSKSGTKSGAKSSTKPRSRGSGRK